jgi:hypothetical protein
MYLSKYSSQIVASCKKLNLISLTKSSTLSSSSFASRSAMIVPTKLKSTNFRQINTSTSPRDKTNELFPQQKETNAKTQTQKDNVEVLEKGYIYFYYRPKTSNVTEPHGTSDVRRLFIILSPQGDLESAKAKKRLIVIPQKNLPDDQNRTRYFGTVVKVTDSQGIQDEIRAKFVASSTRGVRFLEGARSIGAGHYAITEHESHTHLVYVLDLPKEPEVPQKELHIRQEGSLTIAIKNPLSGKFENVKSPVTPTFPEDLSKKLEGKEFGIVNPPEYLDYEGSELILIGPSDDLFAELKHTSQDVKEYHKLSNKTPFEQIFKELHASKKEKPAGLLSAK